MFFLMVHAVGALRVSFWGGFLHGDRFFYLGGRFTPPTTMGAVKACPRARRALACGCVSARRRGGRPQVGGPSGARSGRGSGTCLATGGRVGSEGWAALEGEISAAHDSTLGGGV